MERNAVRKGQFTKHISPLILDYCRYHSRCLRGSGGGVGSGGGDGGGGA